jgi:hypothetical protein
MKVVLLQPPSGTPSVKVPPLALAYRKVRSFLGEKEIII